MRILLISHELSRTGAPRVAVDIARALGREGDEVISIARWPGPLQADLADASTRSDTEILRRTRALARRLFPRRRWVSTFEVWIAYATIRRHRPDVVYANTVKSASYVRAALRTRTPVVLHVHELEPMASETLTRYDLAPMPRGVRVIACSHAVKENLLVRRLAQPEQIDVVESLVDERRIRSLAGMRSDRCDHDGRAVILACARADRRKGFDLWLDVASQVKQRCGASAVVFVWIGSVSDQARRCATDRGLDDVVELRGEIENPYAEMASADVFTLSSREDPFPLVVIEAMTLGLPVVAFDVGGVREQVGEAGVLVEPEDASGFADAVIDFLDDPERRKWYGARALQRAEECYGIEKFNRQVLDIVDGVGSSNDPIVVVSPQNDATALRAYLLKAFDARQTADPSGRWKLRYALDALAECDVRLEMSDAIHRSPWAGGWRKWVTRRLERRVPSYLETVLAWRSVVSSDVVIAMFESRGNFFALTRAARIGRARSPVMAMIVCWLAADLPGMPRWRLALLRWCYRSVDRLFVFSTNQVDLLHEGLRLPREHVTFVPFGVDHRLYTPVEQVSNSTPYVLAVGRDRGRDWPTLFDAVRDTGIHVKVACRLEEVAGLDVPENVELLGFVDRAVYRRLLGEAQAVAVITHDRPYPTGQTVTLEAMAMARPCVVTDAAAMRDYVEHDVNAVLVAEGDVEGLRESLHQILADPELRGRLGRAGREAVERDFNAERMWARIADQLRADVDRSRS